MTAVISTLVLMCTFYPGFSLKNTSSPYPTISGSSHSYRGEEVGATDITFTKTKSFILKSTFEVKSVLIQTSFVGATLTHYSKTLSYSQSYGTLATITASSTPTKATDENISVDFKLILCVGVPLCTVLVLVIVVAIGLCIKRYRKLRRYRQHLVPLTDMDGSDDSDDEDQMSDKEPVFMVTSVNSSTRPILSFENDND